MFKGLVNFLQGRSQYRTECLPIQRLGEVIEGVVSGKRSSLRIEGDDEDNFDSNADLLRELNGSENYDVKSIWRDTFSGKKSSRVYFDVYAFDKRNKRDILISGKYNIENNASRIPNSPRSAWLELV